MAAQHRESGFDRPASYVIDVMGTLDCEWIDYVAALTVTTREKEGLTVTTLSGLLPDQAALYGLLGNLYSLGLVLLHVERTEVGA